MNKNAAIQFLKSCQTSVVKHTPEILTGFGIAGMFTTTILAVKATPKALQNIELLKDELGTDELTTKEVVQATWKCYIPAASTCLFSMTCLIGANSVHARRNAAFATAYKLSETAYTEYRDKVVETIGEKKEKVVREKIAQDKVEKDPPAQIIVTEKGHTLCLDPISGRYFYSDLDKIRNAAARINQQLWNSPFGTVSLNDFYNEIGLSSNDLGYSLGWSVRKEDKVIIDFYSTIIDDRPCIVLDYKVKPKYDYD